MNVRTMVMARVSGTTNPTNLQEIARKHVGLSRFEVGGKKHFQLTKLELGSYRFEGNEQVIVVARAGNTSRRYEIGVVNAWGQEPKDLSGLDGSQVLRFRILIRKENSKKLVATAENLRCVGDGDIESLLPIVSTDLGQRLWAIVIDEDGAVLQCNERVFPSGASAESYAPFRSLVLPEALRQVLLYLGKDPEKINTDGTVWVEWGAWMRQLGIDVPPPSDEDQLAVWITESTGRFCDYFKSADDLQQSLQQGDAA
jgi:hypothetical protein